MCTSEERFYLMNDSTFSTKFESIQSFYYVLPKVTPTNFVLQNYADGLPYTQPLPTLTTNQRKDKPH